MDGQLISPLVSVIIATKDRARYLAEAIESVLSQEYEQRELIIVDGGSRDNTEQIVKSYAGVRFIAQQGEGIADAWNLGISLAKGQLVAFIDSDDIWTDDKLRLQVSCLLSHPEIQYVISKVRYFLQPGCCVPANFKKDLLNGEHVAYLPQSLLARKELFTIIGGFDTKYRFGNDTDWFVRTKDKNIPMAIIPKALLKKRVHESNTSVNNIPVNNREMLELLRRSIERKRAPKNNG